jgi:hypothetical protein
MLRSGVARGRIARGVMVCLGGCVDGDRILLGYP